MRAVVYYGPMLLTINIPDIPFHTKESPVYYTGLRFNYPAKSQRDAELFVNQWLFERHSGECHIVQGEWTLNPTGDGLIAEWELYERSTGISTNYQLIMEAR